MAVSYRSFLNIQPIFHQLCSSDFVQQDWIDHLTSLDIDLSDDFTYLGALIFRSLTAFCHSTNQTVANALDKFLANPLINEEMLEQDRFQQQIQATLESFRLSTELSYSQQIWSLANATKINQIMSLLMGDVYIYIDQRTGAIFTYNHLYNNGTCTCSIDRSCFEPLTLTDRRLLSNSSSTPFTIPGLFQSCLVREATRRSSLQCFYDITCLNTIETYLQAPRPLNHSLRPLSLSAHHRFHPLSTIDELLRSLMIEQWTNTTSYRQYFDHCQVESCVYTYTS